MGFVLLILASGAVGGLLWKITTVEHGPAWAEAPETSAAEADLRSLPVAPDERSHPLVAAALLVLSVLVVAFGIAAGVYLAGRFVFERLGEMLGV